MTVQNKGRITQIIGAVIDIRFEGELPSCIMPLKCIIRARR